MAPSTNANHGKELADEIFDTASNVREPAQGDMLLTMQNMMKEIEQHRKKMTIQKSATSERQFEHMSFRQTKQTSFLQTESTYSRKTEATLSFSETFSRQKGRSMIDKLIKFKKFAPPTFKEAKTPVEAGMAEMS